MTSTAPVLTPSTRNITRLFRTATDAEILAGVEWYDDAHRIAEILAYRYDVSILKTAGVLASVSPLNSWGANVNLATRIIANWNDGVTTTAGYLSVGLGKAARILAARDDDMTALDVEIRSILNGLKITNFYASIVSSGTEGVCVDRHAWSLAVNHRYETGNPETSTPIPGLTGKRYAAASDAYVRAARALNRDPRYSDLQITPAQVQAVTWTLWRRKFWSDGAFDGHGDLATTGPFDSSKNWSEVL